MGSFIDTLRHLDDAGLDVYQYRLLMHVWRVGECWEGVESLSDKCKMSIGKVSETRRWLVDNGLVEWVTSKNGKRAICLTAAVSPHETKLSLYETRVSPHETEVNLISIPSEVATNGHSPVEELIEFFLAITRCTPPNGKDNLVEDWIKPMVAIYQVDNNFENTKKRIVEAVKILRAGGYNIKSPRSIQNTAVGIYLNGHVSGEVSFR